MQPTQRWAGAAGRSLSRRCVGPRWAPCAASRRGATRGATRGAATSAPTSTSGRSVCRVLGPMPRTRSKSSTRWYGRASMMRRAMAGPTRGKSSRSGAVDSFKSSLEPSRSRAAEAEASGARALPGAGEAGRAAVRAAVECSVARSFARPTKAMATTRTLAASTGAASVERLAGVCRDVRGGMGSPSRSAPLGCHGSADTASSAGTYQPYRPTSLSTAGLSICCSALCLTTGVPEAARLNSGALPQLRGTPNPNPSCSTRTASSAYFARMRHEVLISLVVMASMFTPSSASSRNIFAATPA